MAASAASTAPTLDPWWVGQLEPVASSLELPCGPAGAGHTAAAGRSDELGLLVAGLLTRYASGPVALCLRDEGADGPLPVVLDLSDDPGFTEARQRWHTALAASAQRRVEVDVLPVAVRQVVVASGPSADAETPAVLVTADGAVTVQGGSATVVAAHLDTLAGAWAGDARLFDVPLVEAAELDALPTTHGPARDVAHGTILDLVAARTAARPDVVAVRDDDQTLDYAALERRVTALARVLRARGVGSGVLVGLSVRRSADMLVGLLAILRAGAAYVPIDPDYPDDRVAMMIEDAEMSCVVTRDGDRRPGVLDSLAQVDVAALPDAEPDGAGLPVPSADDLAYVIFTSGSTGRPKGVMIGHRALRNFIAAILETPGIGADDRLLAVTTVCFDIAGLELFAPLCAGATVVIANESTVADPAALAARLDSADITVMQATPATWRMLIDFGWPGVDGLTVLCGGEALPLTLAEWLATNCRALWNMYGPTETTIWSLTGRVAPGDAVTLGEPLANTGVHVVGRHGELLPLGVAGELAISGAGLADGYLGRPDLTAERFGPARWDAGVRLYRTGDLVRRDPSGAVWFVGRLDNQVKVRGFRIECGEVETALERLPGVLRAAAVVRPEPGTGVNQLVAFVTGDGPPDTEGLRSGLRQTLPDYMVPSVLTALDAFPMTLNGKIDRKALAALQPRRERAGGTAARTPLEQRLTHVWERVFDFDGIGVDDDIFSLGASSLLVARLFAEISRELDVTLPVSVAFENPTIAGQAALLEAADGAVRRGGHGALVPIRTSGTRPPLFLVHGGAGTVLLYEPLARLLGDDQPVYALQAVGLTGDAPVQLSVGGMARRYVSELRGVRATGPYRIGGYCYGALVAFEMARILRRAGEQVDLLVSFNGPSPSYIHRVAPRFDANGAVLSADREQSTRRRLRMVVHRRVRDAMLAYSALRRRPMPELLRTGVGFQRLSVLAQRLYFPRRLTGSMLVIAAQGLYESADLGWSAHVTGTVSTFAVPGEQVTPRKTMTDAFVGPVVEIVRQCIDGLEDPAS